MSSQGYPRQLRLLTAGDYRRVFETAAYKVHGKGLMALASPNERGHPRLGLIFSKKNVRRAVDRNRLKRIVRESIRLQQHRLPSVDIVVLASMVESHLAIGDDTQMVFGADTDVTIEYDEDGTDELEITGAVRVEGTLGFQAMVLSAAATLTADQSGASCHNNGDADNCVYVLPTAAAGLIFRFADVEAAAGADLYVQAAAGDKINDGTAAQYYACKDDTYGSHVVLVAIDDTEWVTISEGGTWGADAAPD